MKRGWVVLLLLVGFAAPVALRAQASVYGEFSATRFFGSNEQSTFFGGTVGVLFDGPTIFHRVLVSSDVQGRFVGSNGQSLNSGTIGPRFSLPLRRLKITPYGEFMVGFARFSGGAAGIASTDYLIEGNGGVTKQFSPHWDGVIEYSYSEFGYNVGEFNPKTISIGGVFHFAKR
jgi:hypothetical protein